MDAFAAGNAPPEASPVLPKFPAEGWCEIPPGNVSDPFRLEIYFPELDETRVAIFDTGSEVSHVPVSFLSDGPRGMHQFNGVNGKHTGYIAERSTLVRCAGIERRIFPVGIDDSILLGRDFFGDLPFREIQKLFWAASAQAKKSRS
eukprot:Polyplicarium_translucidae@DN1296_c0_g1_i1.p1